MRAVLPDRLENGRVTSGRFASTFAEQGYGCFKVHGPCGEQLVIISSMGDDPIVEGWEHVSVSTRRRTPNWREMCFVKDLFWSEDETVVQFHPPRSEYINNHPNCLHLWRDTKNGHRMPPSHMVGVKDFANMTPEEARGVARWGATVVPR